MAQTSNLRFPLTSHISKTREQRYEKTTVRNIHKHNIIGAKSRFYQNSCREGKNGQ